MESVTDKQLILLDLSISAMAAQCSILQLNNMPDATVLYTSADVAILCGNRIGQQRALPAAHDEPMSCLLQRPTLAREPGLLKAAIILLRCTALTLPSRRSSSLPGV